MDELERSLRELLTDERLDVPVRPGAVGAVHDGVRRRRAATRAALAVSSVVAVLFGAAVVVSGSGLPHKAKVALGGDEHASPDKTLQASVTDPTPSASKSPPLRPQLIPFAPHHYSYNRLVALRAALADETVPPCTADALSMTVSQGASGGTLVTVENTGARCALQDPPTIQGFDEAGRVVTEQVPNDSFVIPRWIALDQGQQAYTSFALNSQGPSCDVLVTRVRVTMPDGAGFRDVDTDVAAEWFEPYTPCGTESASPDDPYIVHVGSGWVPTEHDGFDPDNGLNPTLRPPSGTLTQGGFINYQVRVVRDVAGALPCVPFRQVLRTEDGRIVAKQTSLLPCRRILDADSEQVLLAMQLHIPLSVPAGQLTLEWDTATVRGPSTFVTVDPVPPSCRQDQLRFAAGRGGAAAGTYYNAVVFTNISDAACSLYGYPGVEYVDLDGRHLPTRPQHMTDVPRRNVVLAAHGGKAHVRLGSATVNPVGTDPCPEVSGIDVIAPGLTQQVLVPDVATYCQSGKLNVWPVMAGTP